MVFNMMFREGMQDQDKFIRLMEAQLQWTRSSINDYMANKPWEYGSIDSADYMRAALELSAAFVEASLDGPQEFLDQLSYDYLMSNYACDGICPQLIEAYPDPEEES